MGCADVSSRCSGWFLDLPDETPHALVKMTTNSASPPSVVQSPGWLRSTLAAFFTSKKFLVTLAAGLIAIVRVIATATGVPLDQGALDHIFLALLTYVGAQGITDVGKGAQQARVGAALVSFQAALDELVRSKKFLTAAAAAFVAVVAPLAQRLGIQLDVVALDRLFVGLLAYVGIQGVADFGKGAAQVSALAAKAGALPDAARAVTPDVTA